MPEFFEELDQLAAAPQAQRHPLRIWLGRPHPILAWFLILALVVITAVGQSVRPPGKPLGRAGAVRPAPAPEDQISDLMVRVQARYLVGAADMLRGTAHADFTHQIKGLDEGSPDGRLRAAIIAGEIIGPRAGVERLESLESDADTGKVDLTRSQERLRDILARVYDDYAKARWDAPSVTARERDYLLRRLDWYGRLALAPAGGADAAARQETLRPAHLTFICVLGVLLGGVVCFVIGLIGLITFISLVLAGQVRGGIRRKSRHGGIYAETFALWMVFYPALSVAAAFAPVPAENQLLVITAAMFVSLLVLVWPLIRGVHWRELRGEVGMNAGHVPILEPLIGLGSYVMAVPMLAVGLFLSAVLMAIEGRLPLAMLFAQVGPRPAPITHPIFEFITQPGWWSKAQVFLVACVGAPVVEEIMFRGVLYRHLRDATYRFGGVGSFLVSATVVNFLFAIVHPQGVLAVPALMSLAYALTMAREWRGTLIPSMVMHALNNGIIMGLLMIVLGK
jgi:membrane protease YdiL (CAAX protease family)